MLSVIEASLGDPDRYDALLMKSDTLRLAGEIGVATPRRGTVSSLAQALVLAEAIGFPVYLKTSFSWAGRGVTLCADAEALPSTLAGPKSSRWLPLRRWTKRVLHRD